MTLHTSTFEYLKPTDEQMEQMAFVRAVFADFSTVLDRSISGGAGQDLLDATTTGLRDVG